MGQHARFSTATSAYAHSVATIANRGDARTFKVVLSALLNAIQHHTSYLHANPSVA